MDTITLQAQVGEDRRLVVDLPDEMPEGLVEVTIRAVREEIAPLSGPLPPEELERLGRLFSGGRPSHELIDEDRGEY